MFKFVWECGSGRQCQPQTWGRMKKKERKKKMGGIDGVFVGRPGDALDWIGVAGKLEMMSSFVVGSAVNWLGDE